MTPKGQASGRSFDVTQPWFGEAASQRLRLKLSVAASPRRRGEAMQTEGRGSAEAAEG